MPFDLSFRHCVRNNGRWPALHCVHQMSENPYRSPLAPSEGATRRDRPIGRTIDMLFHAAVPVVLSALWTPSVPLCMCNPDASLAWLFVAFTGPFICPCMGLYFAWREFRRRHDHPLVYYGAIVLSFWPPLGLFLMASNP